MQQRNDFAHATHGAAPGSEGTAIEQCLAGFAEARLAVSGSCMAPELPPGERVRLVTGMPPRFGDVVLARFPVGVRLHRVVWHSPLRGGRYRTRPDRGHGFDAAIPLAGVLAVAVEDSRGRPLRSRGRAVASLLRGVRWRLAAALGVA